MEAEILLAGAIHVRELANADWVGLTAWNSLLPFEQRRVLAFLSL